MGVPNTIESPVAERAGSLVWVDSREAIVVHWIDGAIRLERVESSVPAHHRSTGHLRHDPTLRHGGGRTPQSAGEPHRLEHLKRYVEEISDRVDPASDVFILGPGTVRERLARRLAEGDAHHGRHRTIVCEASGPLTDRQLVARLRAFCGEETRRRTVGAYRWVSARARHPSAAALPCRRVLRKHQPPDLEDEP